MPYSFKADETVGESFRRVVSEEIDNAVLQLRGNDGSKRDTAIHEARKSLKKLRGLLRLLRGELGETKYARENARLRDVGRKLSELRDAAAVIEVFDHLAEGYRAELDKDAIQAVREGLEQDKRIFEDATDVEAVLKRTVRTLTSTGKRLSAFSFDHDGVEAILPGLKRTYRRGRKAMRTAEADPAPENFHAWRKRVKDYWYHTKLLENLWPDAMNSQEKSLKDLQEWLGDDHNLVVLDSKISGQPERFGPGEKLASVRAVAERHGAKLRNDALKLGRRIYRQSPKKMSAGIADLWEIWESELKPSQSEPIMANATKKSSKNRELAASKTSAA